MKSVKKSIRSLSLLAVLILGTAVLSPVQGATLIVDNNPNHQADYRTLQAAVDAASAGDTILVGPSWGNYSYGDALVRKQLFIYGTGYLLKENGFKEIDFPSKVGNISIAFEKDVSNNLVSSPSGTIIEGLITGTIELALTAVNGTNVIDNVIIRRNNIDLFTTYGRNGNYNERIDNLLVSGNFIRSFGFKSGNSGIITNNIIYYIGSLNAQMVFANNSCLSSIMFDGASGAAYNNIGLSIYNNPNNPTSVFIHDNLTGTLAGLQGLTYTWTGSDDARYQLRADSNALGACYEGADCGAFAGATPYVLSGIPARPRISDLMVPAMVLESDGSMTVSVSAEGRN